MRPLCAVLPLVLIAGCGGSGGLSKASYVQKAETLCTQANKDIKALTVPSDPAALAGYVQSLVDIADKATQDLGKLAAPSKDKSDLEKKMLAPLRSQVEAGRALVGKIRTAVQNHDQAALAKLVSNPPTGIKADLTWMRTYGFKECVTAADTSG